MRLDPVKQFECITTLELKGTLVDPVLGQVGASGFNEVPPGLEPDNAGGARFHRRETPATVVTGDIQDAVPLDRGLVPLDACPIPLIESVAGSAGVAAGEEQRIMVEESAWDSQRFGCAQIAGRALQSTST